MSRPTRLAAVLSAGVLMAAAGPAAAPAAGDGPIATAAKRCSVGDSRSYGTTYVRWIRTRNVGCKRAKRLVRAFHGCRKGPRGTCGRVSGFRCRERRFNKSSFSFDSNVRCKRGGKVVKHGYTQWI